MTDDLVNRLRDWETVYPEDEDKDDGCLYLEAADRIEELEDKLDKATYAGISVAASLNAAISLLERGGKKAAPSNKMFAQMLVDYNASLDLFRTTLAELTSSEAANGEAKGGKDE